MLKVKVTTLNYCDKDVSMLRSLTSGVKPSKIWEHIHKNSIFLKEKWPITRLILFFRLL